MVIWGRGGDIDRRQEATLFRDGNVPYLDWAGDFMCLWVLLVYGSFMQTN